MFIWYTENSRLTSLDIQRAKRIIPKVKKTSTQEKAIIKCQACLMPLFTVSWATLRFIFPGGI